MNVYEIAEELLKNGYTVYGRLPSGWILRTPDGRLLREASFESELDRLTRPESPQPKD